MGERAPVAHGGARSAHLVVPNDDAVLGSGKTVVGKRRVAQHDNARLRAGEVDVPHHPNVEVLFVVPTHHALHVVVGRQREGRLRARDSVAALARGIHLGPNELNVQVRGAGGKDGAQLAGVAVQASEILVQTNQGIVDLRLGNVVRLVVVHHVEHHGNGVGGLRRVLAQPRIVLNPLGYGVVGAGPTVLKTRQSGVVLVRAALVGGLRLQLQGTGQ